MIKHKVCLVLRKLMTDYPKIIFEKDTKYKHEYYKDLRWIHKKIKPKKYVEIGVRNGVSIILSNKNTKSYGVDPMPNIKVRLDKNTSIYPLTSDDFYAQKLEEIKDIDFTFIDGMHLFDFVLRDFINAEKVSHKNSVIAMHDTVPMDEETSKRERCTGFWTGDVYKIILILKKYRPDLKITNLDSAPAGLAIVQNLNPSSTVLEENYEKIISEYMNLPWENDIKTKLDIKSHKELKNLF